jgi:predicted metal-dependent hydrolase
MDQPEILEIEHKGKPIHCQWKVSPRARRYRVSVGPGGVALVTPTGVSRGQAERFVRMHADWVLLQLERITKLERKRRPPHAAMANLPQGTILLQGKPTRLEIKADLQSKKKIRILETPGKIEIQISPDDPKSAEGALEVYLKKKAGEIILFKVQDFAASTGNLPKKVSIRSQKSRWGSCSSRGTLSFNWRLMMVPPEVLDYVILHELTHLREPNHSKRFWEKLASLDPEYKIHRHWLKENQTYLYDPLIH